jgi:aryl-phospho-beta-D-glucosidase BglC (GH1 family)
MNRLFSLAALGILALTSAADAQTAATLPRATPADLPRWRGFNLLEKFHKDWTNRPFVEKDFQLIHEFGFNFVRLPMDYRIWVKDGDWTQLDEKVLKEIDQAVAWGERYGVHVMINFHRAPGYTVAQPPEPTSLWTDAQTQRVCAMHWGAFARRYKGIPNERLSFNLFNEPAGTDTATYVAVATKMVDAIRAADPDRLIVSDGLNWGQRPIEELRPLNVAQATRGYTPMELTHYKASWIGGADQYAVPTWPRVTANGTIVSVTKPGMKQATTRPMTIDGPFPAGAQLRVRVGVVSSGATLVVRADGKQVWEKPFACAVGEGEWKSSKAFPEWNSVQCTYDKDYEVSVPAGTRRVELAVVAGDWLRLREIGLRPGGAKREDVLAMQDAWDEPPAELRYVPGTPAPAPAFTGPIVQDQQWLWDNVVAPWAEASQHGIGVMVGEFGAFNRTPHPVVLAWMEDNLENWRKADMGWALWNFRGAIGVLDSERADVQYEDFHGHKLDRKMLELLQRY